MPLQYHFKMTPESGYCHVKIILTSMDSSPTGTLEPLCSKEVIQAIPAILILVQQYAVTAAPSVEKCVTIGYIHTYSTWKQFQNTDTI